MKIAKQEKPPAALPSLSPRTMKVFAAYTRGYVHRHFHSFRILKNGLAPRDLARPLVIFLNHSSWWDPLVCVLLARKFFANRLSFAPIDTAMLERYRFFKRLGFFGVDQSVTGARDFIRTSRAILASPLHALWMTPQGRFIDTRERPLQLQGGLGALAALCRSTMFLPLAIEYTFWTEPRPEILLSFGEPIIPARETSGSVGQWTERLSNALEETQDELAARSCRREPNEWLVLNRGASGVNPFYDAWRWLHSRINRQQFVREHRAEVLR